MIFDKLKDLKVGSVIVKTPIADIGLIQDAPEREISKCYIHAIKGSILTNETGVSAIVCPTNRYFKPGNGSLDEKIFEKAGSGLRRELKQLGTCEEGCAEVSGAYDLPYKYIIHVVGKVWSGNNQENERSLARSYEAVLEKAIIYKIRSIAFPSIGTGRNAFPLNKAAGIAVETVEKFVESHPDKFDEIVWVLREENTFNAYWNIVK